MKKLFSVIACMLLLGVSASAQNLYVKQTSGEEAALPLSGISKITFSSGNMIAMMKNEADQTYPLSSISRLYISDVSSVENLLLPESSFSYSPLTHQLTLEGKAGSIVNVYSPSGQRVLTTVQTIQSQTLDLSHLPKGVYIVESEGKSSKFVR
ncbi:MAG: T9SS type A sorting domain-containing protein [Bacteroidaceae bacterium]|nr:T9SS type A sorting domain-containing protein [Bacteroidaceae bacterium]